MEKNNIEDILFKLLDKANEMYGDVVKKVWFYDNDFCPCCNKRNIDELKMEEVSALSLNAFMYREMSTLIGYFLCSRCVTDLFAGNPDQNDIYKNLEENLKNEYHKHLKSSAS